MTTEKQKFTSDDPKEFEEYCSKQLVNNFFVLLRTGYMHHENNEALIPVLKSINTTTQDLFELADDDKISFRAVSNSFFLNQKLIRLDEGSFKNAGFLICIFDELEIGAIDIHKGVDEAEFKVLMLAIIEAIKTGPGAAEALRRKYDHIIIHKPTPVSEKLREDPRQNIMRSYAMSIMFMTDLLEKWRKGETPKLSLVKRIVQRLCDLAGEDAITLLGLTNMRAYRTLASNHLVNVAILSLMMGRQAGLTKVELVNLGMSALLHDLGLIDISEKSTSYSDQLDQEEKTEIGNVPYHSVLRVLGYGITNTEAAERIVSIFESHSHDSADYHATGTHPDAYAQIIAVANAYDLLTTVRPGRPVVSPGEAMKILLDNKSKTYEDWAVKLLANGIGRYPVGTIVELDSGEKGIVCDLPPTGVPASRPPVRLVTDAQGNEISDKNIVKLDAQNQSGYIRSIKRVLKTDEMDINVSHYFAN